MIYIFSNLFLFEIVPILVTLDLSYIEMYNLLIILFILINFN